MKGVNNDEYNECPMESERNLFEQRDCLERVRWTLEKELKGCACRNPWARVDWTKLADFILEAVQKVEILYDSYLATVAKTRISSTLSISDSNRY
ncbi:hypothetical protein Mapa_016019 [Marchantia paleacea]|nr:hypothetical protein Mapa_016019 [Marchantia paleacea]